MANDRDEFIESIEPQYSVDDILAELSSSQEWEEGFAAPKKAPVPVTRERNPRPREPDPPKKRSRPEPKRSAEKADRKVIRFPGGEAPEEEQPKETAVEKLAKKSSFLSNVIRQADRYADHMFEDAQPSPEEKRAERYVPGVDEERPVEEQKKAYVPRRRRVRVWEDTPPQELAAQYGKGLGWLRARRLIIFLLILPVLYLHLAAPLSLPLPAILAQNALQIWLCAGFHLIALALSYDLIISGLTHLGADTLTVLAALVTLADACTMNLLGTRNGSLPFSLVSMLALALGLWGKYMKRVTLRTFCRTAHAAKNPYLVTLDENRWDSRSVFTKWSGTTEGFGSQIQSDDGAMRIFRPMAGILILACLLFSLISSVGRGRGELILWCLSATLCACASFSGALAFALPGRLLSRRLSGAGAALAGWEGIRRQAKNSGILLTDSDLFPPGSLSLNGVKVFENHPLDKVIAVTATLIRDMGSGLERTFYELLHGQGGTYRKAENLQYYEGGVSAVIRGEQILVGNVSFMHMMDVTITQGQNVKNAVFCAINGELAGIFALNYSLHVTIRPSLYALIDNKISPIMATRDFNLLPAMLHQRFKLPSERMEFPAHERRRDLSDSGQSHDKPIVCVLCREGIAPLSEAVVGAKRLNTVTRANSILSVIGSVIGVLFAFYLTAQMAFGSLSVFNMLVFLLMWLVPTLLLSLWVTRY